jgi:2-polyprenyl-3-methyl-5-hydroxy-6-metoxy-1,4-benzoquinol methylase
MDINDMKSMWDVRYQEKGALWGAAPNEFLVEITEDLEPGTVLDLGCGQGRNSLWLASRGFTVTGLDLSPVAIAQARAVADEQALDAAFESVDLTAWEPE